jgi:hypothetical protein
VLPFFAWLLVAVLLIISVNTTSFIIILIAALYPTYKYLNWESSLWCVTNLRVVDESGFFSRYSKESTKKAHINKRATELAKVI